MAGHSEADINLIYDALGETVSYNPVSGSAVDREAVYSIDGTEYIQNTGSSGQLLTGTLSIRKDATLGVAAPVHGDQITFLSKTWRVTAFAPVNDYEWDLAIERNEQRTLGKGTELER